MLSTSDVCVPSMTTCEDYDVFSHPGSLLSLPMTTGTVELKPTCFTSVIIDEVSAPGRH